MRAATTSMLMLTTLLIVATGCQGQVGEFDPSLMADGTEEEAIAGEESGEAGVDGLEAPTTPEAPAGAAAVPGAAAGTPSAPPKQAAPRYTRVYWVSPKGNDSWDGSEKKPFRTVSRAARVLRKGEAARVLAGEYVENVTLSALSAAQGTAEAPITLLGQGKPKIVPATSSGSVVTLDRSYWVIDGFVIDAKRTNQFAVSFSGKATGGRLVNSEVRNGTGGAGISVHGGATGSRIEKNHIYNFDRGSNDSHGVVVQPTAKKTTIVGNDIHDVSGDSVQCIGPEGYSNDVPADGVVIENNHLHTAQENGIDIKTCHNVVIRKNRLHHFRIAASGQGARGEGIVIHLSAQKVLVEENEIYDAGRGIAVGGNRFGPLPGGVIVQRNRIYDLLTTGGMEGVGIAIENSESAKVLHNTVTRVPGAAVKIGFGSGGPTNNLYVANNIVDSARALDLGSQAPGLRLENNLYPKGTRIKTASGEFSVDKWKSAGLERKALVASGGLTDGSTDLLPAREGIDQGVSTGSPYCGDGPDVGAVETGC